MNRLKVITQPAEVTSNMCICIKSRAGQLKEASCHSTLKSIFKTSHSNNNLTTNQLLNSNDNPKVLAEAGSHRASEVGNSAEKTDERRDTEAWTEEKGVGRRRGGTAIISSKNPAVGRCAAKPRDAEGMMRDEGEKW